MQFTVELGVGQIRSLTNKHRLSRATQLFDSALITTGIAAHPLRNARWHAGNLWIHLLFFAIPENVYEKRERKNNKEEILNLL